jgi:hypothetical protein
MQVQANDGRFTSRNNPTAKGRARIAELCAANQIETKHILAGLLASLGRSPTTADEILAEQIAAATVRGRRQRERGRSDAAERRQIAALMRDGPFGHEQRSVPATEQPASPAV